jgi:hypothetical protein
MPAHPLAVLAAALALAALAAPLAIGSAHQAHAALPPPPPPPPPTCVPGPLAPLPPLPPVLKARRDPLGAALSWTDLANPLLANPVDHYMIFRAPLASPFPPQFLAEVPEFVHDYLDMTLMPDEFVYWVTAHDCEGDSPLSNPASTAIPPCVDSDLNSQNHPPVSAVWADTSCLGGAPCVVTVTTAPPYVHQWGCVAVAAAES